jgi:hypothetical protein
MTPRFTFTRTEDDTATKRGYMRADGQYAAVRIADTSDAETIAGQLLVLAEMLARPNWGEEMAGSFNARR